MGCFEATDAFTQMPIYEGDSVVMIWLTADGVESSRDPYHPFWNHAFGDLTEYVHAVVKGEYDYYGWIKGFGPVLDKENHHPHLRCVFVLQRVWDAIISATPPEEYKPKHSIDSRIARMEAKKAGIDLPDPPASAGLEFGAEFLQVAMFASSCRYPFLVTIGGVGFGQVDEHQRKSLKILRKIRSVRV